MAEVLRVTPQEAREALASGRAILVCAYDDEQKYRAMRLEGAISFRELLTRLPSLPKDQEIVFYCG